MTVFVASQWQSCAVAAVIVVASLVMFGMNHRRKVRDLRARLVEARIAAQWPGEPELYDQDTDR